MFVLSVTGKLRKKFCVLVCSPVISNEANKSCVIYGTWTAAVDIGNIKCHL